MGTIPTTTFPPPNTTPTIILWYTIPTYHPTFHPNQDRKTIYRIEDLPRTKTKRPWHRTSPPHPPSLLAPKQDLGKLGLLLYLLFSSSLVFNLSGCDDLSVNCKDVVMGRGSGTQNHCGNVAYRKLVFLNKVRSLHHSIVLHSLPL